MASSGNKEGNKEVFKWSDEDACTLCEVCLTFIRENGKAQFFKWKEIQLDVERRIGRAFNNSDNYKHKYDTMRRDYCLWKALKNSETGLGWDPVSRKIDASNEWWQRKIKEHPEYKKFRNKGVTSTLEDHWTKLFRDSVATGENVYVPMMNPIEDLTIENENSEEENVRFDGNYISDQFTDAIWEEENFVEYFVEQAKNSSA
ncbi:hypothetical protein RDABS01_009570 [Bienertia sinuspersici]